MRLQRATALLVVGSLLAGALAGCISAKPEPSWEGRKIDEAIKEYGSPMRVSPNGDGKLYVWQFRHEMQGVGAVPGGTRETRVTIRMMTVTKDGIITTYTRVDQ
jgi:hypothetical protein